MGFVVGLAAEARIASRFGYPVQAGGGTPAGAGAAAAALIGAGATALVSFGLAGGLDPSLRPGALVIPTVVLSDQEPLPADTALAEGFGGTTGHTLLAGARVVATAADKSRLHQQTGAHAVDLESGPVARVARAYNLPFVVLRAICDPAERGLPDAALVALDASGRIDPAAIMRSLLRRPGQVPGLLLLARDSAKGRRTLIRLAEHYRLRQRDDAQSR